MKKDVRVLSTKGTNQVAKNIKKKIDSWNKKMKSKI